MNTAKVYQDTEGNDCSIVQMVRREPHWAANRVQAGEEAIEQLKAIRAAWHDLVGNTTEPDAFGNVLIADCDYEAFDKLINS